MDPDDLMVAAILLTVVVVFIGITVAVAVRSSKSADRRARALDEIVAKLRRGLTPLPPELAEPPPRQRTWRGGYLQQVRYRDAYLPLLRNGIATRGLVIAYRSERDSEGPDVDFTYAWLDRDGELHTHSGHESYDAMHAAISGGAGEIVLDMDAGLALGKHLTIVYDARDPTNHVVYDALGVSLDSE